MGNFRPARLPARVRELTDAYGLPAAWLDFANGVYFYPFFKPDGLGEINGFTFGANAPNLTVDGLLVEDADDAVTTLDLNAIGLTPAVIAAGFTVYVEWLPDSGAGSSRVYGFSNGATADRIVLLYGGGLPGALRTFASVSGATVADFSGGTVTSATPAKAASRFAPNDLATYLDGTGVGTDDSAAMPAVNRLVLGANEVGASSNFLSGSIGAIGIWADPKANATLAAMTAS